MFRRLRKTEHKSRQAFTLVELIVVLVVLAVIAAVTVPALTGYIKKAKRDKNDEMAHYALVACQSVITEAYGMGLDPDSFEKTTDKDNIYWYVGNHTDDKGIVHSDKDSGWGDKVLKLLDCERGESEPYILIFGVGNYKPEASDVISNVQQCTVYYIAYVADENSPAVYYVNGEWMYEYPKQNNKSVIWNWSHNGKTFKNTIQFDNNGKKLSDKDKIPLTFYVVSNRTDIDISDPLFWKETDSRTLKAHSDPYFKG